MEDSVYRPATSKVFAKMQTNMTARLRKVFFAYDNGVGGKGDPVSEAEANRFLQAVNNMHVVAAELVTPNEKFGVICHGDLWRQNVLFSYDSCLENQSDSIGVRFDDLHLCRYSSCVTDILYFLFTTVDCDVRRDHAFNFIAAYYDHFNKV
jgi:Ser/Thr protein kinase RdoA (MazF antagonist)